MEEYEKEEVGEACVQGNQYIGVTALRRECEKERERESQRGHKRRSCVCVR